MSADLEKLLPCPFCGGSADISHDHTVEENHAFGCRKCGVWFDTFNSDDAIAAWNTRALTADNAALRANAEKLADAATPFSEMAGEMFARNWNKDGVAISFITPDGPIRLTFAHFLALRQAATALETP